MNDLRAITVYLLMVYWQEFCSKNNDVLDAFFINFKIFLKNPMRHSGRISTLISDPKGLRYLN